MISMIAGYSAALKGIKVKWVTATSVGLTLWAALVGSTPAAQHSSSKTIDQLVLLSALIDVRGLDYSHDSTTDATVIGAHVSLYI
jgi:hypothetical protein